MAERTAPPCCDGRTLVYGCRFECNTCGYVFDGESWPPPAHKSMSTDPAVVPDRETGEPKTPDTQTAESAGTQPSEPTDSELTEIWANAQEGVPDDNEAEQDRRALRALYRAGVASQAARVAELSPTERGDRVRIADLETYAANLKRELDWNRRIQAEKDSRIHELDKKWRDYEENYILPAFKWARELGIDLPALVAEAKGNCVVRLVGALRDRVEELTTQRDSALDRAKAVDLLIAGLRETLASESASYQRQLSAEFGKREALDQQAGELESALRACVAELAVHEGMFVAGSTPSEALAAGRKALGEKS